ncbi:MAG: hypothetical protein Q9M25_01575 [Mariprofundaceae bacterium]|nr:hypothetical protein [Mariprofundaceae bacterium]
MARTNYGYEKRQKELAKQQKREEKRLKKLENRKKPENTEQTDSQQDAADCEAEVQNPAEPAS